MYWFGNFIFIFFLVIWRFVIVFLWCIFFFGIKGLCVFYSGWYGFVVVVIVVEIIGLGFICDGIGFVIFFVKY